MGTDDEIRIISQRLIALEQEKSALLSRQQELLSCQPKSDEPSIPYIEVLSPQQKVELFSRLFRGRDDIHAQRWENKQGRSGYSVACLNEWQQGICNKPKIKCGECNHRSFSSLDQKALTIIFQGSALLVSILYSTIMTVGCWR